MGWSYTDTTGRETIRDGEALALCGAMGEEGDGPCHLQEGHLGLHSDGDARYGQGDDEEH